MDIPEDNTAVIRMVKDLDDFVSQSRNQSEHSGLSFRSLIDKSATVREDSYDGVLMKDIFKKEKENQDRQAELIAAKSQIEKLQFEVKNLTTSRKRARIEYEKDMESVKRDYQMEMDQIKDLKHQLHLSKTTELEVKEELATTKRSLEQIKSKYEQKLIILQREKHSSESKAQENEQKLRQKVSELKGENLRQQTELHICEDKVQEYQEQFAVSQRSCSEMSKRLEYLEEAGLKAVEYERQVKELQHKLSKVLEDNKIALAMKSQLDKTKDLEKENKKLKDDNAYFSETQDNVYLLREQNKSLNLRIEKLQIQNQALQKVQIEYEELKTQAKKWEVKNADGTIRALSPGRMSRSLADLQNTNAILLERQGQLSSSLNLYKEELKDKEQKIMAYEKQLSIEERKTSGLSEQNRKLQTKLTFVTKARDGYKKMIESYDTEVTVNLANAPTQKVIELEQINNQYHAHLLELEKNINYQEDTIKRLQDKCFKLEMEDDKVIPNTAEVRDIDQQLILNLRENIAELEKNVEKLSEEKYVLEGRLERCEAQGDYDPTKTKIVHLTMNPSSVAKYQRAQKLEQLQEENIKLKKRIKILEEAGEKVQDISAMVDAKLEEPTSSKALEEVKQQLNSAELKNKRLMEAFKKTSQEFRNVCYQLLGYKIDIPVSNQYRLLSMYASSPDDTFLFQQSQSGEIQLLGTEFSHNFEELMKTYLHGANSIPAFLSSVTMELFNSQTMIE